jgi:hypothetical protein
MQHEYEESLEHIEDEADGEDEDENQDHGEEEEEEEESLIDYGSELDAEEQNEGGAFYEQYDGEYYGEDGDSDLSDAPLEQFAQKPGNTQDDAIELSD